MTDVERLRAAADILAGPEGVTRSLLIVGHRGIDADPIADLLRAVAGEGKWLHHRQPELRPDHHTWTAALALADTILEDK